MRTARQALLALAIVAPLLALAAEPIKMMVPANPGGGWDATGRAVLQALESEGLHKGGAQVINKGGAGGTIGLAEFVSTMKGNDNAMMVMGAIMVGGILTNKSAVTLDQVVPLARLTIEYNAIAVAPNSPFKTLKDFTDALKADPGKVSVGGGSAGGVDHITLALIGQAVGVPAHGVLGGAVEEGEAERPLLGVRPGRASVVRPPRPPEPERQCRPHLGQGRVLGIHPEVAAVQVAVARRDVRRLVGGGGVPGQGDEAADHEDQEEGGHKRNIASDHGRGSLQCAAMSREPVAEFTLKAVLSGVVLGILFGAAFTPKRSHWRRSAPVSA